MVKQKSKELPVVVGIGASAGGLEAFSKLLKALPSDTGMAFVLLQHLERSHDSLLSELLARTTSMQVLEIEDGSSLTANCVYVIPPNVSVVIKGGVLRLLKRPVGRELHQPINEFFSSLSEARQHQAIGVVLSGTASDGTVGLEAIKAAGGITFAQRPESARSASMPRSAIAAGVVDFVLSPEEIAGKLSSLAKDPYLGQAKSKTRASTKPTSEDGFEGIFHLLHDARDVDFSLYRSTTIRRRIARRMLLDSVTSVLDYAQYLRDQPVALELLYQDLLIGVTSFFRDTHVFECLQKKVFPELIKNRATDDMVRIWVSGCSTGQEAYSLSMAFLEFTAQHKINLPLQIFATDLNAPMLEKARAGWYSDTSLENVSPERRKRFFNEEKDGWRISEAVRRQIIFSRQNVFADPPFSRMDLVSCRNLLIYLEPALQSRVIPTFHYALKPHGVLLLGASETVGRFADLFTVLDTRCRFYSKRSVSSRIPTLAGRPVKVLSSKQEPSALAVSTTNLQTGREVDRLLLLRYAPSSVVVNDALEVVQFRGSTSQFLEAPSGKATFNLLKMAREGLMLPLRRLTEQARQENRVVRHENIRYLYNGQLSHINLEVQPLKQPGCLLVLFEVLPALPDVPQSDPTPPTQSRQIEDLNRELLDSREYLRFIQRQNEDESEQFQATNAEMQSSSEELQSLNEELETAKEELESTNEEMQTLNEELTTRNTELGRLNTVLTNFQASAELAIVAVSLDLAVQRFTPQAESTLGLRGSDLGQPVSRLSFLLNLPHLEALVLAVIKQHQATDHEIRDRDGRWFLLRVRPYYSLENQIDGAVLVLFEMDALKRAELERERLQRQTETVFESLADGLMAIDFDWTISYINANGARLAQQSLQNMVGHNYWVVFPEVLGTVFETGYKKVMTERVTVDLEAYYPALSAQFEVRVVPVENGITVFFRDVTDRHNTEILVAETKEKLRVLAESQQRFLADAAHELRAPLAVIQGNLEVLERFPNMPSQDRQEAISDSAREATRLANLANDLLALARGDAGDGLRLEPLELSVLVSETLKSATHLDVQNQLELGTIESALVLGDASKLKQLVLILLDNAMKYSPEGGKVSLSLQHQTDHAELRVSDSGQGIAPEELERVFERFYRTDTSRSRQTGGTGLGLPIARWIAEQHHAKLWLESSVGVGTTAVLRLPLMPE